MKKNINFGSYIIFNYKGYKYIMENSTIILDSFSNGIRLSLGVKNYKQINIKKSIFEIFKIEKYFLLKTLFQSFFILIIKYIKNESSFYYKILNKFVKLRYKNIVIGDKLLSNFYRDNPKGLLINNYVQLLFFIIKSCLLIEVLENDFKRKYNLDKYIIYTSHTHYINGIFERYFCGKNNYIIRAVSYPHCFSIFKNIDQDVTVNSFKSRKILEPVITNSEKINIEPIQFLSNRINNPSQIRYLKKWDQLEDDISIFFNKKISNIIICLHSFIDAMMEYGNEDGMLTAYDWARLTIKFLLELKLSKKYEFEIYLKPHPTWSINYPTDSANSIDVEIYKKLLKSFNFKGFKILDPFQKIGDLNSVLSKDKTLFISHNGTIIPEAAFLGFKTISSISSPWSDKYTFTNIFYDLEGLKKLILLFLNNKLNLSYSKSIKSLENFVRDYYYYYPYEFTSHFNNHIVKLEKRYGLEAHSLIENINNYPFNKQKKEWEQSSKFIDNHIGVKTLIDSKFKDN